jgi:predicted outer membrane repeat protein
MVDSTGTGDAPTIQAGLDSASAGDTVKVECGTYYEHDIVMKNGVVLWSVILSAGCVTIDAQGLGRGIICDGVDATSRIGGMTITDGHAVGTGEDGCGGGIICRNYSAPVITTTGLVGNTADLLGGGVYCTDNSSPDFWGPEFRGNQAALGGGGLACETSSSPYVFKGLFRENTTSGDGGGMYCRDSSSPQLENCTFILNSASGSGGGLFSRENSTPTLTGCIAAFNTDGEGVYAYDDNSIPSCTCCDIFGNEGGDWIGRIASQNGTLGNFSLDPLFCDFAWAYLPVEDCSPTLSGNHPTGYDCQGEIGTHPDAGCDCGQATHPASWGLIKALYK